MGKRRKFTNEFKLEAVRLTERGDVPVAQVARELGLNETVLRRWMALYGKRAGANRLTPEEHEELIRLRREAIPFDRRPRYVFRDNDGIFGYGVRAFLESCGIEEVRTAYRSPWQNPYVERMIGTLRRELLDHVIVLGQWHLERMIGTLRRELLDHVIVLGQWHLERLLREYLADYYHTARTHQGLGGETPIPLEANTGAEDGELIAIPVVGGLHHRYQRRAA